MLSQNNYQLRAVFLALDTAIVADDWHKDVDVPGRSCSLVVAKQ